MQKLEAGGLSNRLAKAIAQGDTEYSVARLGIPGLRHFMYKSRSHVQVTMPTFEEPYDNANDKRRCAHPHAASLGPKNALADCRRSYRLITLYQTLFDAIHGKSGQERTLKLQYIRTSQESVMGWVSAL